MKNRSDKLRLVVKQSGKTAKQIISSFKEIEKNERSSTLKYPKDTVTISRHLNDKRPFDLDTAVAYGKALDTDPAEICFEPVIKSIRGYFDPLEKNNPWGVHWYFTEGKDDMVSLRIPREFYANKFRLLEAKNVTNNRHGMVFIYEYSNDQYANPRNYNQLGLCKLKSGKFVVAVPVPSGKKNNFTLKDMSNNILYNECELITIHSIVSCLFPAFYKNY